MFCPPASTTEWSFSCKKLSLTSQAWNYNSQQPQPSLSLLYLMLPCREHQNQYSQGLRPVCVCVGKHSDMLWYIVSCLFVYVLVFEGCLRISIPWDGGLAKSLTRVGSGHWLVGGQRSQLRSSSDRRGHHIIFRRNFYQRWQKTNYPSTEFWD